MIYARLQGRAGNQFFQYYFINIMYIYFVFYMKLFILSKCFNIYSYNVSAYLI